MPNQSGRKWSGSFSQSDYLAYTHHFPLLTSTGHMSFFSNCDWLIAHSPAKEVSDHFLTDANSQRLVLRSKNRN